MYYHIKRTPGAMQRNQSQHQLSRSEKKRGFASACKKTLMRFRLLSWLAAKAIPMHIFHVYEQGKQLSLRLTGVKDPHHVQGTNASVQKRRNCVSGLYKATPYKYGIDRLHFPNIGRRSDLIKLD